jgi:hypothetical protein
MGTPLNFLVFCWSRGIRLSLDGKSIRYAAKDSIISDELLSVLKLHKPALVYLLGAIEDGTATREQIYQAYEREQTRRTA